MPAFAAHLAEEIEGSGIAAHEDHSSSSAHWHFQQHPLPDSIQLESILHSAARRRYLGEKVGFLDTDVQHIETSPISIDVAKRSRSKALGNDLPTSLLMQTAAMGTDTLKDPLVGETELTAATGLAVPLVTQHVSNVRSAADIFTAFNVDWGHNHWDTPMYDPSFHDYQVDIKPLSLAQIARLAFAAVTNVMEHMLGPHFAVHLLALLALAAIWAPYDKMAMAAARGVKSLASGLVTGVGVVAKGLWHATKATGEFIGKAAVAGAKLTRDAFKAAWKGGKATVKAIGKGAELLATGIVKGAELLGKGIVKVGEAIGKGAEHLGKGIVTAAEAFGKGMEKFGNALGKGFENLGEGLDKAAEGLRKFGKWVHDLDIPVLSASLKWAADFAVGAWKGIKKFGELSGKFFKGAWKGMKFVAKGLWKGAKLVGTGLLNVVKLLDKAVKATGRGILALGNAMRGITGEHVGSALLIAGAVGAGALLLAHGMRKRKGRSTMTWGAKKRGAAGRKINPVDARAAALKAAAEREAARKKKKQANGSLSDAPAAVVEEPKRRRPRLQKQARKRKPQGMSLEDLMAQQRHGANSAHKNGQYVAETGITPLGGRGFAAAAAAGGAAMLMSGSNSKASGNHGTTVSGESAAVEQFQGGGLNPPGPVVIGTKKRGIQKPHGPPRTESGEGVEIKPHSPSPKPIPNLPRQHEEGKTNEEGQKNGNEEVNEEVTRGDGEHRNKNGNEENMEKAADMNDSEDITKEAERQEHAKRIERENDRADREIDHLGMHTKPTHRNRGKQRQQWKQKYHDWDDERIWSNPSNKSERGERRARTFTDNEFQPSHQSHFERNEENVGLQSPQTRRMESYGSALGGKANRLQEVNATNHEFVERSILEAEKEGARVRAANMKARELQLEDKALREPELARQPDGIGPSVGRGKIDVFPSVVEANRERRASKFDLKTVQSMDDDEFGDFRVKVKMQGQPPSRNIRHVSSSLAFTLPRRHTGQASAFLGEILDRQDGVNPDSCSIRMGFELGDADFAPLYYIDQDGQPRDFLDPAKLKHAFRKAAARPGLVGFNFLEAPVAEQRLRSS